jgi:hypothetical protein
MASSKGGEVMDEQAMEREFLMAAIKRSRFLQINEPKKANREYDKLHRLKDKMRSLPDKGEAALKRICEKNDNADVKIMAAAALLGVDEQYAIGCLEDLMKHEGLASFTAEMTIREWHTGAIKDFWG